jgi:protein tyrosine/serine phosphatase
MSVVLRRVRTYALLVVVVAAACRTAMPSGGLPANFGIVDEGKVYRGAQPTPSQLEALQRRGVRTILKLNSEQLGVEEAATARLGLRLIYVPLNARTVGRPAACASVARAYEAMTDSTNWPLYVHCSYGRDRTGFLVGLYRERVQHWLPPAVEQELQRYGHNWVMHFVFPNITSALASGYEGCL